MKCPYCSCDMVKGRLMGKGTTFFLPDGERSPVLYTERAMEKHNCIYLPPYYYSFNGVRFLTREDYPIAYVCKECSKIIVDY